MIKQTRSDINCYLSNAICSFTWIPVKEIRMVSAALERHIVPALCAGDGDLNFNLRVDPLPAVDVRHF